MPVNGKSFHFPYPEDAKCNYLIYELALAANSLSTHTHTHTHTQRLWLIDRGASARGFVRQTANAN